MEALAYPKKILTEKCSEMQVTELPKSVGEILNMTEHCFALQYARVGKFINFHWIPKEEEFVNLSPNRIWPPFR